MSIVAEGVETQEQLSFLADEGCDSVQGFLLGKPQPIGHYAGLVGRNASGIEAERKLSA
jgi:EAL domain-containing protein (putative c-di-GMP-specific phosphodiesterase class I)